MTLKHRISKLDEITKDHKWAHNSTALLALLDRVQRSANLFRWTQPDCRKIIHEKAALKKKHKENSQSIVACRRSTYGINKGGVSVKSKKCPSKMSELQNDNSIILTTNSRAGWEIACEPRPRPYQRPVHHARIVSSCLNSRDRKTEMRILWTSRWMKITAMRPSTAWDVSQTSKNHSMYGFKTSHKPT